MKVSIIMPTYNKSKFLDLTLSGFINQTFQEFELIIVDDGSIDETKAVVNNYKKLININYIYQTNKGRSAARNKGIEMATGEYLIFCDDDRIPSADFVKEHIFILEKHESIVTIGFKKEILSIVRKDMTYYPSDLFHILELNPKILSKGPIIEDIQIFLAEDVQHNFENTIKKYIQFEAADNFNSIHEMYNDDLNGFEFGWVLGTTANLGVKAEIAKDIRFDENYKGWGMEDTNYSYELYRKGCNFYLAKEAINYHQIHGRDNNYMQTIRSNLQYFCVKYNEIETALFYLLMSTNMSIIEINDLYKELERNDSGILYENFVRILQLFYVQESYINKEYLS